MHVDLLLRPTCYGKGVRRSPIDFLFPDVFVKEVCHDLQRLFGFRQLEVIPEGMRQRFKNHQLRIYIGSQKCQMKHGSIAQEQVARAGDKQARRQATKIGE